MTRFLEKTVAITGVGQSEIARPARRSALALTLTACLAAIEDAGLDRSEIDGVATWPGRTDRDPGLGPIGVDEVKDALRLPLSWQLGAAETPQYGPMFSGVAALASGMARHVLVFRTVAEATSRAQADRASPFATERVPDQRFQWLLPFGAMSAANWTAFYAQRHFQEYGTTEAQLGQIAVNARRNAMLNPKAIYRTPLTLDDYLASRYITTPLRLYDCDVPVDASTAVILSRMDETRGLRHPPLRIEAVGSAIHDRPHWDQRADLTTMMGHEASAMMWSRTDLKPKDVQTAQLYDGFSVLTLMWLEALGFCGKGEGGPFIEGGHRIARDGPLPINTHGSQLSEGRTHGFGLLHEAALQMWGRAGERQLETPPQLAVAASGGGNTCGCMVLVRE